jgi:enoyl-CoA hydratase/carnithine racemase
MKIRVETQNAVMRVTIDRLEIQNRVDRESCLLIARAFQDANADEAVRVVVLTAAGPLFCSGGQVDGAGSGDATGQIAFADAFAGVHRAAAMLSKPLIAAINGPAMAGGLSLMSAADLAISVASATFGLPELQAGAFPMLALATAAPLLPRKLLFDLIYNARLLTADEALQHGLLSRVVPDGTLDEAVAAQSERIKAANPVAIALGRSAYEAMRSLSPEQALRHGGLALVQMSATRSGRDAVAALARGEHGPGR